MSIAKLAALCAAIWSAAYAISDSKLVPTVELAALMLFGVFAFLAIVIAFGRFMAQDEEGNI